MGVYLYLGLSRHGPSKNLAIERFVLHEISNVNFIILQTADIACKETQYLLTVYTFKYITCDHPHI